MPVFRHSLSVREPRLRNDSIERSLHPILGAPFEFAAREHVAVTQFGAPEKIVDPSQGFAKTTKIG